MGLFSGIKKAIGGIGKVLSGLGQVANVFKGFLQSPLGGLLMSVFPPAKAAMGFLSFTSMLGGLAQGVGGGQNY